MVERTQREHKGDAVAAIREFLSQFLYDGLLPASSFVCVRFERLESM